MSRPRVFKSTDIILGEKKEISLADLENIIKMKHEEFERAGQQEIEEEQEYDLEEISRQVEELLQGAEEQSQQLINDAHRESQMIIQEAYNDSQAIFEKAKAEGYEEGFIEGKNKGYLEAENIVQEATEIKEQTFRDRSLMGKELEEEVIRLVIATVKKVIHHEIKEDHELLLNLIREGLKKSTFSESLTIKVSEEDYDLINASKNSIYMMTDGIERMEIKCEPSLIPGSILIETLSGTIDSSVETQINTVEKLFNELLRSE